MTSMADCLNRRMDFGEIDRVRGMQALSQYEQLFNRYSTIMDEGQAAARAAADMKEATAKANTSRQHKVLNQLQAMKRIRDLIETSPDPAVAVRNLLEYSDGSGFKGESVRSLTEAYEDSINASIRDVLERVGTNVWGSTRNGALLEDLIREAHGEATGNSLAKVLAETLRRQQQRMRRLFNAHGGDIGDLADYGVMHSHDGDAIRAAGFQRWAQMVYDKLAWDRIPDLATGKPFAAAGQRPAFGDVQRFLQDVFDGITTRGWDDREPSMTFGGRALYNQRAEHRVLHFRDGSAWLEYNRDFGTSDPFSAMVNGLHGLARDVALMRVLGPNPRAGLTYAEQVATKRAAELGDAELIDRVARQSKLAKAMLAHQDGSANRADHMGWARFFSGTRAVLTSIQLGSAVLSSVTDAATITAAANTVGMRGRDVLSRSVTLMRSEATRQTAARMGYVAETLADAGASQARYMGQVYGSGLPERMAGFTMRATGLAYITDMRKIAFQMELSGYLAENADRAFDAIDAPLRKMLSDRGIAADDWDLLRDPATRFVVPGGADFITAHHWLETQTAMPRVEAEGLAMRLQMAIREQVEYAIPTATLEGRARLQGTAPPGSIAGEFLRSAMMYKSFALSLTLGQYRRFVAAEKWGANRWWYAAKVSAMLIVTGALAIQLKELAKGNDPRPMTEGKFWMAALFQGGGLGIFGDFFAAEQNRVGGGIASTLAGPVVSAASSVIRPVASNVTAAVKGENTYVGRDAANLLRKNTPFFSSAWYARTAYSRLVADNLQAFLDPQAEVLWRRQLRAQAKEYGTQPFIPRRGSNETARLPNLGNMFGGSQ